MKKIGFLTALALVITIFSCQKEDDPFLISNERVGKLTKDVQVYELKDLYAEDSIVSSQMGSQSVSEGTDIEIYEKGGELLLVLQPSQEFDTTSTIGNIQIMDPRFKTETGLNIQSTFGDIVEGYSISRIENTLSSAVVFIDDINGYITIDKKELPSELRFDTDTKIEATHIPNDAKFKHFMIGWN